MILDGEDVDAREEMSGAVEKSKSLVMVVEGAGKANKKEDANNGGLVVDGMLLTSQQEKTMYNGARSIAAAAKSVLLMKTNPLVPYFKERSDGLDEFDFSNAKCICKKEIKFYEARDTPLKVLKLLKETCDAAPEWLALPTVALSAKALVRKEERAAEVKAQVEAAILASKAIVRPAHDNMDPSREIIQRPGLLEASGAAARATTKQNKNKKKKR